MSIAELNFMGRRRLPEIRGAEAAECGLACMAMIGRYHGHDIDLSALAGPGDFADLPGIHWRHQRFWTAARPSSGGRAKLPGARTTLPGGDVAPDVAGDLRLRDGRRSVEYRAW